MTMGSIVLLLGLVGGADGVDSPAQVSTPALDPAFVKQADESVDRALAYLRGVQSPDGSFADGEFGPAVTALVVAGALKSGRATVQHPLVADGLTYLEKHVQPDGGIYFSGGQRNYPTAIAVLALVAANKDGRYQQTIERAVEVLKKEQWDETEGIDLDDPRYGGAGYGKKSRPDLSNTAFLLDALEEAGVPSDDPAFQRAIVFVRRCQNFSGEGGNDLALGSKLDDGGFYYTPAEKDYNPGGGTTNEGLRSYGSMTYAGLKSFIHAGVDRDDPRVQAALGWIRRHYTVAENPGVGEQGLFYYYHTFAKTLDVLGEPVLVDAAGKEHHWRADLIREVVGRQQPDGSWKNTNPRWLENDSRLVTGYVLLALSHATAIEAPTSKDPKDATEAKGSNQK